MEEKGIRKKEKMKDERRRCIKEKKDESGNGERESLEDEHESFLKVKNHRL